VQTYYTTFTHLPVVKYLGYDKLRVQLKTGHKGKKGTPLLSGGVPYEITVDQTQSSGSEFGQKEEGESAKSKHTYT